MAESRASDRQHALVAVCAALVLAICGAGLAAASPATVPTASIHPAVTAGALECSKDAADSAALDSSVFLEQIGRLGVSSGGGYEPFAVVKVVCRDFTRDGRRDMAVLFMCCTAASPTPVAIFQNRGDHWRLRYAQTKRLVYGVASRGGDLLLRSPHFEIQDALCCPSRYRHYRLHWTGRRFKLTRRRLG